MKEFMLTIWLEPHVTGNYSNITISTIPQRPSRWVQGESGLHIDERTFAPTPEVLSIACQFPERGPMMVPRTHPLLPFLLDALVEFGCVPDEVAAEYRKPPILRGPR